MSQDHVEIAKRVIDAFNRRDQRNPATYDELYTLDFEWFPSLPSAVGGGGYKGREGIETVLGEVRDTWAEYRLLADEFRDLGDRVLMLGRQEARGRGSGVPVDAPFGVIFDFRADKISRMRSYNDHGEVKRAAGLSEESERADG